MVNGSNLECGMNGALYFVAMDENGGASKYSEAKPGAKYGMGYCDAHCPHDIKFINGDANVQDWKSSDNGENAETGIMEYAAQKCISGKRTKMPQHIHHISARRTGSTDAKVLNVKILRTTTDMEKFATKTVATSTSGVWIARASGVRVLSFTQVSQ
jgi:hypothetical protein